MPDLVALCAALGGRLEPYAGARVPATQVTGVHVSELADPTPFLEGGELLLTTGMPLVGRGVQTRAYAARLRRRGVAGLGLGLGPVHDEVPPDLPDACAAEGVPLFVVPPATPFLAVARTYWGLLARTGEQRLSAALGAHRALV
ncbi:PucR family transcriptional regulator ligand-binding domain-containing protein, partial [Segeticoccus rhizosphaerae]|uniref:PucR family transcriptional regulator ligand-binding domain-containing protein n=1 Tax=Segeticoccus rhizosphaerae TaxID=1104777 RepID=UPI001939972B